MKLDARDGRDSAHLPSRTNRATACTCERIKYYSSAQARSPQGPHTRSGNIDTAIAMSLVRMQHRQFKGFGSRRVLAAVSGNMPY